MLLSHSAVSSHLITHRLEKAPASCCCGWCFALCIFCLDVLFCFVSWEWNLQLHLSNDGFTRHLLFFSRSIPSLLPNPTTLSVLPPQPQPPHIPQPLTAALWSQTLTPNTLPWRSEDFTSLLPRPSQGATRSRLSLQENQLPKWLNGASRNPEVKMALRNRILALWIWMMQAFQLAMCSGGSVWRMIHLFGPLISLFGLLTKENYRKWEQKKNNNNTDLYIYIYTRVCGSVHVCICNVFVFCLSAEGQKWTFCIFSKADSKSLTREGPNCTKTKPNKYICK